MVQYNRLLSDSTIINYLKRLEQKIDSQATKGSGSIIITDPDTGVETIIGTLPDGTTGLQEFVGDTEPPPVSTAPTVTAQPGSFVVSWNGQFLGGMTAPRDFVHVNVLAHKIENSITILTVPVGVIRTSSESILVNTDVAQSGETWAFSLASQDYNGNISVEGPRSASLVMIDSLSTTDTAWIDLQDDVSAAQTAAQAAQTAAQNAQDVANQVALDQTASEADIAAAQLKADQAFNNATAAATAAGNAQTSADNKNRIWYQDSPPAGTGHRLGDTWFDTNDGNKIYLWSGEPAAWNSFQDTTIAAAQNTANTAITAANGKSTINFSLNSPSGTGTKYGDIWFKRDVTSTIIGQWEWTQGTPSPANDAWQPRTISESVLGNISAGKIVAGWLQAGEIKAGSITADKLTITDFTNLVDDPDFIVASGNYMGWILIPQATIVPTVGVEGTTNNALKVIANGTINDVNNKSVVSTQAGEKYYGEIYVKQDGTGNTGLVNFAATVKLADGTFAYPTFQQISSSSITTAWSKLSGVITVPANGVSIKARVSVRNSATNGIFYFQHAIMRRQAGATSIANGAITTSHITASTLDASVLSAGTITSTKIAAKSIGVDKLLISSTDNLLMEADFSNGGTSWQLSASNFISPTASRSGVSAMRFTGFAGTTTSFNLNNKIPISADARFRGSMWLKSSVAAPAGAFKIVGRFYYNSTQFNDITLSSNAIISANTWTLIDGIVPATIPSNTIAVEFYISINNVLTSDIVDIDFISVARASDGKLIVDGSIVATKLETDLVLGTRIIAGTLEGTRAEMSPTGFRVYAKEDPNDPLEVPHEAVRMGTVDNDYFAVIRSDGSYAATMSEEGTISAEALSVNADIEWKGESFTDMYNALPKGLVAWGSRSDSSPYWADNSYQPYLSLTFDAIAGRAYRVWTGPISMDGDSTTALPMISLHYTAGDTVTVASGRIAQLVYDVNTTTAGRRNTLALNRLLTPGTTGPHSLLLSYGSGATGTGRSKIIAVNQATAVIMAVEDIGLAPSETGESPNGTGDDATTNPTPPPAKINYVKTYYPTGTQSYTGSGAQYEYNTAYMYSGLSPAGYGDLRSMAMFSSAIATDVGAGTITKVRVYAYYDHWYNNSGGTADITVYGGTALPGTLPTVSGTTIASSAWPKPGGRWVTLPSAAYAGIKAGTSRGIMFGGKNRGYLGYGYLHDVRLEVSYTK